MTHRSIRGRFLTLFEVVAGAVMAVVAFGAQPALADFDNIFFFVNGDSTASTMTQGDLISWGSNCDTGTTINWEIWYDANSNSVIDPAIDALLNTENITDGNAVTEEDPILDGYTLSGTFPLSGEPGAYIFRATEIASGSTLQKILTMTAMPSPPNQLSGQIMLPGVSAPNSILANKAVFAESEAGAYIAVTDNMGMYSMEVGAEGTGLEIFVQPPNVAGFVATDEVSAVASGVVTGVDLTYEAAVDSIWGMVEDETGTALGFRTNVGISSNSGWRGATTSAGSRYVIYLTGTDHGWWWLEFDSRVSPDYLAPNGLELNLDTIMSLEHDFVLTGTDAIIYAEVTENGGLPVNNYRIDAYSELLMSYSEAVSGVGSSNIVPLHVSSLDPGGWSVYINPWDDNYQMPPGLIAQVETYGVSPGDTVTLNLVDGKLISGVITQDPEDDPIFWGDVYVGTGMYSGTIDGGGTYWLYSDTGYQYVNIGADGYITNPAWRELHVTGDTTVGLGFTINEAHCHVTGALTNVPLPLDGSYYEVLALTGLGSADGYYVSVPVDAATGTYSMFLCDGNWTIIPPEGLAAVTSPGPAAITIAESPDIARTVDFAYFAEGGCCMVPGDANSDGDADISDLTYFIDFMFAGAAPPACLEEFDIDSNCELDISDLTFFIDFMFAGGSIHSCHDCGR